MTEKLFRPALRGLIALAFLFVTEVWAVPPPGGLTPSLVPSGGFRIDGELMAVEELLHDPDLYARDPKRFADLTDKAAALRAEKDAAEERWLEVAAMAEELGTAP